jgi:hypothetical protein
MTVLRRRALEIFTLAVLFCAVALDVRAELPPAATVLTDLGYSAAEISEINAGKIVTGKAKPAHERDLAAAFAFLVPVSPAELIKQLKAGLMASLEPNMIKREDILAPGSSRALAALTLVPGGNTRAKRYLVAKPGTDLNLSADEMAAFNSLPRSTDVFGVEAQLRRSLIDRYHAYRANGLDGIAPYARENGVRSAADDLRASLASLRDLQKYAPAAYGAMMSYPDSMPAGADDVFAWSQFEAHGVPTIALVHVMFFPDGDAFVVMERQYYVSEGFNCEQAVAGLLPVQAGTVVVYSNHTSTDQVTGPGSRAIGSRLLSSELRTTFAKVQQHAK